MKVSPALLGSAVLGGLLLYVSLRNSKRREKPSPSAIQKSPHERENPNRNSVSRYVGTKSERGALIENPVKNDRVTSDFVLCTTMQRKLILVMVGTYFYFILYCN